MGNSSKTGPVIVVESVLFRPTKVYSGPFGAYAVARKMFRISRDTSIVQLLSDGRPILTLRRIDGFDKVSDWYYHGL